MQAWTKFHLDFNSQQNTAFFLYLEKQKILHVQSTYIYFLPTFDRGNIERSKWNNTAYLKRSCYQF